MSIGAATDAPGPVVDRFGVFEASFAASGQFAHPYLTVEAVADIRRPDGGTWRIPLFWDGGQSFRLRLSPDLVGEWTFTVRANDPKLAGTQGRFTCRPSSRRGSLRPMTGYPRHFERQDGSRFWFLGDTAWALYTDSREERHNRAAAQRYMEARAAQGFNVLHSMLLSEAGWGNTGGPPFHDLSAEQLNPAYWQEVDQRLAFANDQGFVCGLALAWGDKGRKEPYAWRRLPSFEAKQRYARYVAARYSAFDVYFIVSGEWHAEIRATQGATEETVRREFVALGDALRTADPHGRMMAIHPMTSQGSVREFNTAAWFSFGDYQQNYRDLHARLLLSRPSNKPVVNAEYGYFLRDQNGDGVPDKDNSTSLDAMRHATWDILMAGGYVVTGFGTTYFGGNRDPGPFDLDAPKNRPWETQLGHLKRLFTGLEWWKLEPHDELLRCATPRGRDGQELKQIRPSATTYWCLAEPGRQYLLYARGLTQALELTLADLRAPLHPRQWNPRSGEFTDLKSSPNIRRFEFRPPNEQDWVVVLCGNEYTSP